MDRYTVAGKPHFSSFFNYKMAFSFKGLLDDIGQQWDLSDDQKGLIQTSFIICYFASAPVFGFLGDRYSRKWLMAFGVLAWGACTFVSSLMTVSFEQTFLLA